MQFTPEHAEIRRTLRAIIDKDINPHVDKWEEDGIFPAHEVFKKLGDAGLLGINKPAEYGGMGLDYSYAMVMAEELGHINCGSVPMAIGVQTDMATPALARYGSDELRKEFLAPSIAGDYVACLGVSEVGAGSDVASLKTTARKDRRRLGDQRRQDVDDQRHPGRLDVPAGQHRRRPGAQEQVADLRADEDQGRAGREEARQARHALLRHRADLLRRGEGAGAQPDRPGRHGLRLPDAAVPGGAAVGRHLAPWSAWSG